MKLKKKSSPAGNRTPVSRVTGGDTYHYTTEDTLWARHDLVISVLYITIPRRKKNIRCEQGSNLRGKIPLDFESNALTTRPSQLQPSWKPYTSSYIMISCSSKIETSQTGQIVAMLSRQPK